MFTNKCGKMNKQLELLISIKICKIKNDFMLAPYITKTLYVLQLSLQHSAATLSAPRTTTLHLHSTDQFNKFSYIFSFPILLFRPQ